MRERHPASAHYLRGTLTVGLSQLCDTPSVEPWHLDRLIYALRGMAEIEASLAGRRTRSD